MGLLQAKLLVEVAETNPMLLLEENCNPSSTVYLYSNATGCLIKLWEPNTWEYKWYSCLKECPCRLLPGHSSMQNGSNHKKRLNWYYFFDKMAVDTHLRWANEGIVVVVRSLAINCGLNVQSKVNLSRLPILRPWTISAIVSVFSRICLQSC